MNAKTLFALPALALALTGQRTGADNSMSGMDMAGPKAAQAPKSIPLTVTAAITPAAPRTGDNTLDLTVLDYGGKPVTGLKLTTSVAMTTMDMGTTHPVVTGTGSGHYTTTVNFGMAGPWRVIVRDQGSQVAALDFEAGAKTPWKSPQIEAATGTMDMAGMKTGIGDMKTATVPQLPEKGTYTAAGDEDWKSQTGFGHNAPMVGMMNQMMVGGSGMEGMKMPAMNMKFGAENYAKPEAGDATGAGDMAGMTMGGGKSGAKSADKSDNKPASMAGMRVGAPAPTSPAPVTHTMPPGPTAPAPMPAAHAAAPPKVTAVITAPKAGENILQVTVTDAQGQPVTGAKIATTVVMTSMDMGTNHPAVRDVGKGQYVATVNFGMAGPWRVTVGVAAPGRKSLTKAFTFDAK